MIIHRDNQFSGKGSVKIKFAWVPVHFKGMTVWLERVVYRYTEEGEWVPFRRTHHDGT